MTVSPFSRLTHAQYLRTLRDLAAPVVLDATLGQDLPTEITDRHGFLNNWESQGIEEKLVEQYELVAGAAAAKIAAGIGMMGIPACQAPKDVAGEASCGAALIDALGPRAYRRPLEIDERTRLKDLFDMAHRTWGLPDALKVVTSVILSAPQLVYRMELGKSDGIGLRLTGYEVASRLSYLVWGTTPDAGLMDAARGGALDDPAGVEREALRLLRDPRATDGLSEFAAQWLRFAKIGADAPARKKDRVRFKDYSEATSSALAAGLRLFVGDSLLGEEGGLRTLLSSNRAWVNGASAWLYGSDIKAQGETLVPVDLDPKQRRGFLTQAAFLAGFAHETVQAPVQRGTFVLEHLLCSPPPPPPPNVPGAPPAEATDVETTRQKFVRGHEGQTACKSCHERIDAVGFTFENYDAIGRWQATETVAGGKVLPVDASGAISGTSDADGRYANAVEMIDKLSTSEQVAQCFVENFTRYALARDIVPEDGCTIAVTTDQVIADGGKFRSLVLATIKSPQFRYRAPLAP